MGGTLRMKCRKIMKQVCKDYLIRLHLKSHVLFTETTSSDTVQIKLVYEDLLFVLNLYKMTQSPNISKAEFSLVRGENQVYEQLRSELMATFNEVC